MAFNLINFKKGTLSGLNTLKTNSGVEEGTFYLTIDNNMNTSRLFIGTSATTALPVNSNITVVQTTDALTDAHAATFNDGDFAYVTTGNILAVRYNGHWTQINAPDSRAIKDLTPSISTSSGTATITWTLRDQNDTPIQTSDATPVAPSITMTGANGVAVSNTDRALTITGTSYEMSAPAIASNSNVATLKLQSKANATASAVDVSSVTLTGGTNVTLTGTANAITIAAEDTTMGTVTVANNATSGFDITVADSNSNSDTGTIDPKITLGTHTDAADQISFISGVANLPVYTKDEIDSMNKSLDAITYRGTVGTGGSKATAITGIPTAEKGASTTIETGMKVGYAYKLVGDSATSYTVTTGYNNGTAVTTTAHGGDIIIANGTEATSGTAAGYITTATLFYDIVPSGDEVTVYQGLGSSKNGNGIEIKDGASTTLASLEIAAGSQISVSSTHTDNNTGDGAKAVVTVAHGTISSSTTGNPTTGSLTSGNTQSAHGDLTINAVTGLTTDNGHVTAVTVTPFKVTDTVSQLDTTNTALSITRTAAVSGVGNYATVTSTIALMDENSTAVNSKSLAFKIGSDNLDITKSGDDKILVNFV